MLPGKYLESCTGCKKITPSDGATNYFIQCSHCTKDSGVKTLASLYVDTDKYPCREAANVDGTLTCVDKKNPEPPDESSGAGAGTCSEKKEGASESAAGEGGGEPAPEADGAAAGGGAAEDAPIWCE